jgi:hypothetical protein
MPSALSYPGVYIEEVPSGVRTITGVATSITAFIGTAKRGPIDRAVRIGSYADYERTFGGLWEHSTMSYAVQQFYLNEGVDAIIIRIHNGAQPSTISLPAATGPSAVLVAANPGAWSTGLRALVDHETATPSDNNVFNLTITELDRTKTPPAVLGSETFRNVSIVAGSPRDVRIVLEQESQLVRWQSGNSRPNVTPAPGVDADSSGVPGAPVGTTQINAAIDNVLDKVDLFNLLVIPPPTRTTDISDTVMNRAISFCKQKRAMFIADGRVGWTDPATVASDTTNGIRGIPADENMVMYFPRIMVPDPLKEDRLEQFAPSGAIAGVFARTDRTRGVWKAPAGLDATMRGVKKLAVPITDFQNGLLNPLGLNCLRTFPDAGTVVWGARTRRGSDNLASEWKYVPVRRLALFLEESLYRGTQWVVFEPNDEPLWSQIRLNLGAFMHSLYRQGAFQGGSPKDAYFVKCDKETTTQTDINNGIVNIIVGFAPLKPAEFVVIKFQQMAGQIAV